MSHPPDRNYSFDDNDELSLNPYQQQQYNHPQPYRDIPSQETRVPAAPTYQAYVPDAQSHRSVSMPSYQDQFQSNTSYDSHRRQHPATLRPINTTFQEPTAYGQPQHDSQRTRDLGYSISTRTASTTTPGMDNLGEAAAGGGIAGIALGVANTNSRESGLRALEALHTPSHSSRSDPPERDFNTVGTDTPYIPEPPHPGRTFHQNNSYSSTAPLGAAAAPFSHQPSQPYESSGGIHMADYPPPDASQGPPSSFADNPYKRYSSAWDPRVNHGEIYPDDIEDDGDDGINGPPTSHRRSMLGFGGSSTQSLPKAAAVAGATTGVLGSLGNKVGRKPVGMGLTPSGNYRPITGQEYNATAAEKSEWLKSQTSGRKRLRWIVGTIILLLIIGGIVGGVIAGIKASQNKSNSAPETAAQDDGSGDLNANSPEIKALLGNSNLHRVFPGIDYTPFDAQYPACLTNPPSQNNVTRDMAVLSQLTNVIRLYGTDCNQTEMVLHSIKQLGLTDMKVWLAVWLDNNATTNARGMSAMYDIIDKNGATPFAGVIIGNEVLFRKDMTVTQLADVVSGVRSNFTAKSISLPLAVADLGTVWTTALVDAVDVVMSNIHPFFGGVAAPQAAAWTWNFWQTHDVFLTQGTNKKNIISETGWPSTGGNDCSPNKCTTSTQGAVAGIDEMNTFMADFVCQSLANGTNYFWFEAFDEPWKVIFNTPTEQWEDKWGLMDSGRNLKPGLQIPGCGGQTV